MKPSEQLTDEQRNRVREIAESSAIQFGSKEGDMFILGGGGQDDIERAILQALDEIGAEWAKDAERFQKLQNMAPVDAQAYFWTYSSRKQRAKAIDDTAAIAQER